MRYEIVDADTEEVINTVTLRKRDEYLAFREQAEALGFRLDRVGE